jgi:hypothetical protein
LSAEKQQHHLVGMKGIGVDSDALSTPAHRKRRQMNKKSMRAQRKMGF